MKTMAFAILATVLSSSAWAQSVSKAKIAELSAHRVDKLIVLGKLDATFRTKLERIDVTSVSEGAVVFKSLVSQTQPGAGKPMQVELSFDKDGKALAFKPIAGGVAGPDPQWPDKDALTLAEDCLHYVIDNASDAKVKPFNEGYTFMVLTKGMLDKNLVARGEVNSSQTASKLDVYVKTDGTFVEADVVP